MRPETETAEVGLSGFGFRRVGWLLGMCAILILALLPFSSYIAAMPFIQEFGAHKPDSSIFEHALELIGAHASETLFVGDNPVADICGARGVGMRTAWLHHGRNWPVEDYRPDHQLDAVWEAPRLLGS